MMDDELGPLPFADRSSALQRESLAAVRARLPADEFVFREEGGDDYGVDGTLEVLIRGLATNMRAHAQLKARTKTSENSQGVVAVRVDTSNLNYLLNAACPLYLLYRPEVDEVRFAFAREEWLRIERADPSWRTSAQLTLHFRHVLARPTLAVLREAIVRESQLARAVLDRATRLSTVLGASIRVDAAHLEVTDSEQLLDLLQHAGFPLINAGAATVVIDKARQLSSRDLRRVPKAQLVFGFALYSRGRYVEADAQVRGLFLEEQAVLSPEDRSFAQYLLHSIDYLTGHLSREDFLKATDAWVAGSPVLAAQHELIRCWELHVDTLSMSTDPATKDLALRRFRRAIQAAKKIGAGELSDQAALMGLLLDAQDLTARYVDLHAIAAGDALSGEEAKPIRKPPVKETALELEAWKLRVTVLSEACRQRGDVRMFCEARLLVLAVTLILAKHDALFREAQGLAAVALDPATKREILEVLAAARQIESLELELRAELELADLEDVSGNAAEAIAIATRVKEKAGLCRAAALERVASRVAAGELSFAKRAQHMRATLAAMEGDDFDLFYLSLTEGELKQFSEETCKLYGIPRSRAANLLSTVRAHRLAAAMRRDWCRHFMWAERTESARKNLYWRRSQKLVQCLKFGHTSRVSHVELEPLAETFKRAQCHNCEARDPLVSKLCR